MDYSLRLLREMELFVPVILHVLLEEPECHYFILYFHTWFFTLHKTKTCLLPFTREQFLMPSQLKKLHSFFFLITVLVVLFLEITRLSSNTSSNCLLLCAYI